MSVARIMIEHHIGETRALALDEAGRAVSLFSDRWSDAGTRTWCGEIQEATVREIATSQGGVFLELASGEEGFLAQKGGSAAQASSGLSIGGKCLVETLAEAQNGKRARVRLVKTKQAQNRSKLHAWQAHLKCNKDVLSDTFEVETPELKAAFEDGLAPTSPLPNGGYLRFYPSPALVAVDVDTAGRLTKGRPAARARKVNLEAAQETARQLLLRNLAGTVVLDCVAPLLKEDGGEVKRALLGAYRGISARRIEALAPSPFGLLQVAVARHARPLHEVMLADNGGLRPEALALKGLREVAREAVGDRGVNWVLALPDDAYVFHKRHEKAHREALINRFGGRIEILSTPRQQPEVYRK